MTLACTINNEKKRIVFSTSERVHLSSFQPYGLLAGKPSFFTVFSHRRNISFLPSSRFPPLTSYYYTISAFITISIIFVNNTITNWPHSSPACRGSRGKRSRENEEKWFGNKKTRKYGIFATAGDKGESVRENGRAKRFEKWRGTCLS